MNGRNYRVTPVMRDVLAVIAVAADDDPAWGFSVCEATGHGPGSVYPALDKLMNAGVIRDEMEDPVPPGREARRFYRLAFSAEWYQANGLLPEGE